MYGRKRRSEVLTGEITDKKKDNFFIESVLYKSNLYKWSSNLRPSVMIHARQPRWSDWRTSLKMTGISRTLAQLLRVYKQQDSSAVPIKNNHVLVSRNEPVSLN